MPTSIHLPKALLDAVDRRARALKMSRNRFIVRALERELRESSEWTPDFFDRLERADPEVQRAVDELEQVVRRARRSKGPPAL